MPHLTHVLQKPVLTEKTVRLAQEGTHVYEVHPAATKIDIAAAARLLLGAKKVKSVRLSKVVRKSGRPLGEAKTRTRRQAAVRAFITLEGGQVLDSTKVEETKAKPKKK